MVAFANGALLMEGGALTVICADAVLLGSVTEAAVTVAVPGAPVRGAV